jgi:hypothetical protein
LARVFRAAMARALFSEVSMFFPPCPNCKKNTVVCAEDEHFDQNARTTRMHLAHQAAIGHPHPVMKGIVGAVMIGRAVYKRWPGGGLKRCTDCGLEFR